MRALLSFCEEHSIPYERCGKVVVATSTDELPRLEELFRRGVANGVEGLEMIGPERLRELEPHATGIKALHAPTTGIIDFPRVALTYARLVQEHGGEIKTRHQVQSIRHIDDGIVLTTTQGDIRSRFLLNCGGLHCDRVARLAGAQIDLHIVPSRGEYYTITPQRRSLVKNLIYPVPDPALPFLGVHFTRTIDGVTEAGPNAVLAFSREGYRKTDFLASDLQETLTFSGFWRMARKYWKTGVGEMYRSYSKSAFLKALQRLLPDLRESDLQPEAAGASASDCRKWRTGR